MCRRQFWSIISSEVKMFLKKLLFWVPRVLSGLITLFFLVFVLEGLDDWVDGLIHLTLGLLVLGFTVFAWKRPRDGGIIFMLIGGLLLIFIREEWTTLIIWTVILITGLLFFFSSKKGKISK